MNIVELKQVSEKPLCYDVIVNGTYKGLLHYSWSADTVAGAAKAWLLEVGERQYRFASKRHARRFLGKYPV